MPLIAGYAVAASVTAVPCLACKGRCTGRYKGQPYHYLCIPGLNGPAAPPIVLRFLERLHDERKLALARGDLSDLRRRRG